MADQQFSGKYNSDQVRSFPNVYLGSREISGVIQAWVEIMGNALDEATSGFGDRCIATVHEDNSYSIRDYGRGVPLGWNPEFVNSDGSKGQWGWWIVYNQLYSSGKYTSNQDVLLKVTDWAKFDWRSIPYLFTVGMHGVGATAVQYTSEYFLVESYDGKQKSSMRFEVGQPVWEELKVEPSDEPSGTLVRFKSDDLVFTDTVIPPHRIESMVKSMSMTSGVTMEFIDEARGIHNVYPGSNVQEYIAAKTDSYSYEETFSHYRVKGNFIFDQKKYTEKVQICVARVAIAERFEDDRFINNQIPVSTYSGVHYVATNDAIAEFFHSTLKGMGIAAKPEDYSNAFTVIVDTLVNDKGYRGQTKDSLDDEYILKSIYENLKKQLAKAYRLKESWVMSAVAKARKAATDRLSRTASTQDRKAVRDVVNRKLLPEKFTSCTNYETGKYEDVELILTEGESAKTAASSARDATTQALYSLRGKMLNPFDITVKDAMSNTEISDIVNICGIGIAQNPDDYDFSRRKVGKILIASDADDDGYHIRNLAFVILYMFMPDYLYEGRVYIAETPRHGVKLKNGEEVYCRTDEELQVLLDSGQVKPHGVTRYKGLGQVNPDVLYKTTLNPSTRQLTRVMVSPEDVEVYRNLSMMYGKDAESRKSLVLDQVNPDGYDGYKARKQELVAAQSRRIAKINETYKVISL